MRILPSPTPLRRAAAPTARYVALALAVALASAVAPVRAQRQLSVGVAGGGSAYMGDLAPASPVDHLTNLGLSYGVFVRVPAGKLFAGRLFVQRSVVRGDDARRPSTRHRNLSFSSEIDEAGLLLEIGRNWGALRPYGFVGGALYRFDPQTDYLGRSVALQPLGTEGQGSPGFDEPYELTRLALPFGAGLEVEVAEHWRIGLEVGARATFFDHLDDVSGAYAPREALGGPDAELRRSLADRRAAPPDGPRPTGGGLRGDPGDNDWYHLATLTVARDLTLPRRRRDVDGPPCYTF